MKSGLWRLLLQNWSAGRKQEKCFASLADSTATWTMVVPLARLGQLLEGGGGISGEVGEGLGLLWFANCNASNQLPDTTPSTQKINLRGNNLT